MKNYRAQTPESLAPLKFCKNSGKRAHPSICIILSRSIVAEPELLKQLQPGADPGFGQGGAKVLRPKSCVGAPPSPRVGAPTSGKSWIRHCVTRLCIKIIQSNVKKFGYNEHPFIRNTLFCSFLHVVSRTQCKVFSHIYRPQTKLQEGNVFTRICSHQ